MVSGENRKTKSSRKNCCDFSDGLKKEEEKRTSPSKKMTKDIVVSPSLNQTENDSMGMSPSEAKRG